MDDEQALKLPEARALDDYNEHDSEDDADVLDDLYSECRDLEVYYSSTASGSPRGHEIAAALFSGCVSSLTEYFAHMRQDKESMRLQQLEINMVGEILGRLRLWGTGISLKTFKICLSLSKIVQTSVLEIHEALAAVLLQGPTIFDVPGPGSNLRTSIIYAHMFLSEQGENDFYEHNIDWSMPTPHYLNFTSWIETIEENVTLLCDLAPTIRNIMSEAFDPQIPSTLATSRDQLAKRHAIQAITSEENSGGEPTHDPRPMATWRPNFKKSYNRLRSSLRTLSNVAKSPGAVTTRPASAKVIEPYPTDHTFGSMRAEENWTGRPGTGELDCCLVALVASSRINPPHS